MSKKKPWFLTGDDLPDFFVNDFVERAVSAPLLVSNFDLKQFSRLLLGSISLSLEAKTRVLDSMPTLSCFQYDALEETFRDETAQFIGHEHEYPIVLHLSAAAIIGACALALHRGAGIADAAEEAAMIRAMGAAKRKSCRRTQGFLKTMPERQPVVEYVYGETQLRHADIPEIPEFLRREI